MKALLMALGLSLVAGAASAYHYDNDEYSFVKASYNTAGYYTMADAQAAAATSVADLKMGILPDSKIVTWVPDSHCQDVNTADSRDAVSDFLKRPSYKYKKRVEIYNVDYKTAQMSNGTPFYYATVVAKMPCLKLMSSRRHDRR